jgi:uncharacterized damage-inducible protein DinB
MASEAWLRGPLPDVDAYLMPVAHALVQAQDDIIAAVTGLTAEQLWTRPNGAASLGFHLRHVAGSIDRLLTYARGGALDDRQQATLHAEAEPGTPPASVESLVAGARTAIDEALRVVRSTPRDSLLRPRSVGRARLPSTVIGLLFHIAEHTQRHVGQIVTTAKIVRGENRQ